MNQFRFSSVSIVPQYAMSAMNPTRKIGQMTAELLESRHVDYGQTLPERSGSTWSACRAMCWAAIRSAVRWDETADGDGSLDAAQPIAPHRRRDHVGARRLDAEGRRRNTRQLPRPRLCQEHDRDHPRRLDPLRDRRQHHGDVRREARREGRDGRGRAGTPPSLHAGAHRFAARGRRALCRTRLKGIPGSPPALLDPPTGCRYRARCPLAFEKCVEEPPFVEIAPAHHVACWKVV